MGMAPGMMNLGMAPDTMKYNISGDMQLDREKQLMEDMQRQNYEQSDECKGKK